MRTIARERFIPEGAEEIRRDGVDAVVYRERSAATGRPSVKAYRGRRSRPDFYISFRSDEAADAAIEAFFGNVAAAARRREEARRRVREFRHGLKVGDVLLYSWGYDQTNPEFYEVVEAPSPKSVRIREIAQEAVPGTAGFMCENVRPVPGRYIGAAILKRVRPCGDADAVGCCSMEFGTAFKWERGERGTHSSWYA